MEKIIDIYHILREIWDKIIETKNIWFPSKIRKQLWRGHRFEKYVIRLVSPSNGEFSLLDWTSDIDYDEFDTLVERNLDPDLLIKHRKTGQTFAIECKFRSWITYERGLDGVEWARQDQIDRYQKYSKVNRIPVYIALGLGIHPTSPQELYLIPIEIAKYPNLYLAAIKDYKRDVRSKILYREGKLV